MDDRPANSTPAPSPTRGDQASRWAITSPASHARLWIVAAVGLAADLWTKHWAFTSFEYHPFKQPKSLVLIDNLCTLQVSLNPGALFGLGAGMAAVFVGASVLALIFVLYLFANTTAGRWSMHIGLGLVLGGALGNLYDRTTQSAFVGYYPDGTRIIGKLASEPDSPNIELSSFPHGLDPRILPGQLDQARSGMQPVVRDFIRIEAKIGSFYLWPWIFNIADALLVIGVIVIMINFWREHKHEPVAQTASISSPPAH